MKAFAFVSLIFFALNANAFEREEVHVALGGWSHHVVSESITNETHNIVAVEYGSVAAGYFKNSFGRDSFFIARHWRYTIMENVDVTASIGVNYGYRGCYGDFRDEQTPCLHGHIGIGYTKYMIEPTIKLFGDAIVFSPEVRF